jgi:hypothetical protein
MAKKEDLINQLQPIINETTKLEKFLIDNSNLPGPRSNLELAFAFADIYNNLAVVNQWLKITADQADANNPRSFLAFCAAVSLGNLYNKYKNPALIDILKHLANDRRWRMREAVAFAFQKIGENDFNVLKTIFSEWIYSSNNHEKRAILVALAHPKFLNAANAHFCFEITDIVLQKMQTNENFDVLKKGLEFTISVFVAADFEAGFAFIKKWLGVNKTIDRILKENLKKKRITAKHELEAKDLLSLIQS